MSNPPYSFIWRRCSLLYLWWRRYSRLDTVISLRPKRVILRSLTAKKLFKGVLKNVSNWIVKISRSKTARTLLPSIAGFLGYGGWAFFCNLMHGVKMGVQSGLVQGSLSFSITLVFNGVMEFLYKRFKKQALEHNYYHYRLCFCVLCREYSGRYARGFSHHCSWFYYRQFLCLYLHQRPGRYFRLAFMLCKKSPAD